MPSKESCSDTLPQFIGPYWKKQTFFVTGFEKFNDFVFLVFATNDVHKRKNEGTKLQVGVSEITARRLFADGEFVLAAHRVERESYFVFKSENEAIERIEYGYETIF